MKTAFLQLLTAAADGASVHVIHGLEQCGIELDGMIRFRKGEFRHGSVELQLKALQQNRVKDAALFTAPTENAISENQFDALTFALDAAVERIKSFKNFHRRACRLFRFCPLVALQPPTFKALGSRRILRKLQNLGKRATFRLFQRLLIPNSFCRIVPAILQPIRNFFRRFRPACQLWSLHFQNVCNAVCFAGLRACAFCLGRAYFRFAALNRGMLGKVAQPKTPGLFVNPAFRGIAMLVQRFQIAKDTRELFTGDAEFLGIHGLLPFGTRQLSEGGSRRDQNSKLAGQPQWYDPSTQGWFECHILGAADAFIFSQLTHCGLTCCGQSQGCCSSAFWENSCKRCSVVKTASTEPWAVIAPVKLWNSCEPLSTRRLRACASAESSKITSTNSFLKLGSNSIIDSTSF